MDTKLAVRSNSPAVDFSLLDKSPQTVVSKSTSIDARKAEIIEQIEKSVMYLCYIKEPSLILVDKRALNAVKYLRLHSKHRNELQVIFKYITIFPILTNILNYYYKQFKILLSLPDLQNIFNGVEVIHVSEYEFMVNLIGSLWSLTNCLKKLCYEFHDHKGTQAIFNYLSDTELIDKLSKTNIKGKNVSIEGFWFLRALLGSINNISTIAGQRRKDFEDMHATSLILDLLEKLKSDTRMRIQLNLALANIVNDHEIETLPDIKAAIKMLVNLIKECATALSSGKNNLILRRAIDIEEEEEIVTVEIYQLQEGYHIYELINGLYKLAINDTIKYQIYEDYKMKDYLEIIIFNGNDIEKAIALKLLWQLCFDKRVAAFVHQNSKLHEYIKKILNKNQIGNLDVKKYCEGILWSLGHSENSKKNNENFKESAEFDLNKLTDKTLTHNQHIMISYNAESRKLCTEIKLLLERNNHKVWIDIENIHGSSLEAMATAVEQSKCVLICMTEKYKLSPNCRAEAEYAFKLNKSIIPLILQPNYTPDGWLLGIILGSKIYINFTKYSFEEASNRLVSEINSMLNPVIDVESKEIAKSQKMRPQNSITLNNESNVSNLNNHDVIDWLKKSQINIKIIEILKDFNGKALCRLRKAKTESADYFYKVISNNNQIDVLSVLQFTEEFEKLF